MRVLPWLLAGAAIGAGIAVLVLNDWETEYDTEYDSVEGAARKTFGWGTRQRAQGKVGAAFGRFKEGVGQFTGDSDLEAEGAAEKVVGNVRDKAGELGHAVAQTVHDLNK
ncbi:MAG TPA: CsbD family protein [Edaphobacter sp.]|nr:CsbD family protein [Edaphobacter sp.]